MKTCFIIMPITTPDSRLVEYGGDKDHFKHVLNSLFIPAVKKAEFEPIPPIFDGSDNITAAIIERLNASDLVLCDMSIYNPNVFFELGIRTALNKPVCVVRDDLTLSIPFDNSPIAAHTYLSGLKTWDNESQVDALAIQVKKSEELAKGKNPLWRIFGITSSAVPAEKGSVEEKIGLLAGQVNSLIQNINMPKLNQIKPTSLRESFHKALDTYLNTYSAIEGFNITEVVIDSQDVTIYTTGKSISDSTLEVLKGVGKRFFFKINVINLNDSTQDDNPEP